MKTKRRLMALTVFLFVVVLAGNAFPYTISEGVGTLDGLKGIYVRIAPIPSELEEKGLSAERILEETLQQLTEANIKVLPQTEFDRLKRSQDYPLGILDIGLSIVQVENINVYNVNVRVRQLVFVARKPVIKLFAPTWEEWKVGHSDNLASIAEVVKEVVAKFISDFSSENPKERQK